MQKIFSLSILLGITGFLMGMNRSESNNVSPLTQHIIQLYKRYQEPADAIKEYQGKYVVLTTPFSIGTRKTVEGKNVYTFSQDSFANQLKEAFEQKSGLSCVQALENDLYHKHFSCNIEVDSYTSLTYPYAQPLIVKNFTITPTLIRVDTKKHYIPTISGPVISENQNLVIGTITQLPLKNKQRSSARKMNS